MAGYRCPPSISGGDLVPELSDEIRGWDTMEFYNVRKVANGWADKAEDLETERAAWKEAFAATRAYYSNNNGPNSTRYRAAIKQLKEMKLIK